jgi:ubiquinone/menaquinone biosynthesis C-methylase UbiE
MNNRAWDLLWKFWYPALTRLTGKSNVEFLNYGYDGDGEGDSDGSRDGGSDGGSDGATADGPTLEERDERDRSCIQLYHRVVGAIDIQGLSVLEVSCGHGGGASYVARYLKPRSVCGVDRNGCAVEFCEKRYQVEGLTFCRGNAMALDFADDLFDAVVNVEASHCYPDVPRFLSEVRRVLRPGGHFLYADFRQGRSSRAILERQLKESGMQIIACEDISPGVVRGMEMNHERYMQLIDTLVGRFLRGLAMRFAGVKGSSIYNSLKSGDTVYLRFVLRNP